MTLTAEPTATAGPSARPVPLREGDDRFVALAAEVGRRAAPTASQHDLDGTFVAEAYDAMRDLGYLALAVPEELGGLGATMRQVVYAQAELARWDGSSALGATMHLYNSLVLCFRRDKGAADAEAGLRRIASEGMVIATSGGSDWVSPTTVATPVEGGFRVSGRKRFCSQSPVGDVMTTSAVVGEPGPDAEVLHFALPMKGEGVRIVETWDTMGMRGTASHDVLVDDVFIPAEKVVGRRPYGAYVGPLQAAVIHFAPIAGAVYWGIAAGARDHAVGSLDDRKGTGDPTERADVQRQIGLMDARLRVSWWSLLGAATELEAGFAPDGHTSSMATIAKREAVLAAREVVDLAMELTGGGSYFRSSPLERAHRDVRAGAFHPLTPEATLVYAGRAALGKDLSTV